MRGLTALLAMVPGIPPAQARPRLAGGDPAAGPRRLLGALAVLLVTGPGVGTAQAQQWAASYPEGPVWIDGTLFWAEMGADRVMAWAGEGAPRAFFRQEGCGPTALARYRGDEFVVLCHRDGSLVRLGAQGQPLETIRDDAEGHRLRNPNDASADGWGGVWFSDPGAFRAGSPPEGAVFYLAPGGRLTRHLTGLSYGNGVLVDGDRLLVSEHLARRVLSYPLSGDALGAGTVLIDFAASGIDRPAYPEAGPDGLEIGPDGTLWVAEYGAGRLHGWRAGEGLVGSYRVDSPYVTNIAFAPDGRAALTGAFQNDRQPFAGRVLVIAPGTLPGAASR